MQGDVPLEPPQYNKTLLVSLDSLYVIYTNTNPKI